MTNTATNSKKPLGGKAYGSIPHLPGSRLGPGDHHCHEGQARICTVQVWDHHDLIIVQEKLDGSCVSAAKINGEVIPLTRAGYHALTSPYEQHHLWAAWVGVNVARFDELLGEGERVVGEWLAQAHGTRYALVHEPFVAFDLMRGIVRAPCHEVSLRVGRLDFRAPFLISLGAPITPEAAMALLEENPSNHRAVDPVEGVVYRVERHGAVDFLAKYVRPEKQDGVYLPEMSGQPAVWNWRP